MENEIDAIRTLISEGVSVLALALALAAPAGLCIAASGSGRFRNRFTNLGWIVILLPFNFVVLYLFGWTFLHVFTAGPGVTDGFQSAWRAVPWGDVLGPGFHRTESGAPASDNQDFLRFVVMGWLASTVLAGAILERAKLGGLLLLTTLLSGLCVALGMAWGWTGQGWMVVLMGYHDPLGVTTIATLSGGFALGVLRVLGPRIASVDERARVLSIDPHSPGMVIAGQFMFFVGLFGLCVATTTLVTPVTLGETQEIVSTTVYGAPLDPAGVALNLLAAASGSLLMAAVLTRADISRSSVLIIPGLIGTLPAADFLNPLQTFLLAMFLTWACRMSGAWLERRFSLDDVTVSVSNFGFAGFWGLVISGVLLWGIPTSANPEFVHINPFGNTTAALILFWILGFVPGHIAARIIRYAGGLRLDRVTELAGGDLKMMREAELSANAAYQREDRLVVEQLEERV